MTDPIDEITVSIRIRCSSQQIIELMNELDDPKLLMLKHVKFGLPLSSIEKLVAEEGKYMDVLNHMKAARGNVDR